MELPKEPVRRSVALAGATGLVGRSILNQLLADPTVGSIHVLARRESSYVDVSPTALYRWCEALGIVGPHRASLVHLVDASPKLLDRLCRSPELVHTLAPEQFERVIADLLSAMGYEVSLTGPTTRRDGGIDLVAVPRCSGMFGHVVACQIKHHSTGRRVERAEVDRLLSWRDVFHLGLLVTNTTFTRDAFWIAHQDRHSSFLRLRGFEDLKRWFRGIFTAEAEWREIPDSIELAPGIVVRIPKPSLPDRSAVLHLDRAP